jgi:hypothetical protein
VPDWHYHRPCRRRGRPGRRPSPARGLRVSHPGPEAGRRGCATGLQGASSPMRPGWCLRRWPTTCCAGSPRSGLAQAGRSWQRPARPAAHPARTADPVGSAASVAPARRLAVGPAVPSRPGPPADYPPGYLTVQTTPDDPDRRQGRAPACPGVVTDTFAHSTAPVTSTARARSTPRTGHTPRSAPQSLSKAQPQHQLERHGGSRLRA